MQKDRLADKKHRLIDRLKTFNSLAVAFSGGADSAFLAAVAREVLGSRMLAVKAVSALHPGREHRAALAFVRALDIPLTVIETRELQVPGLSDNPPERCYLCKQYLMSLMKTRVGELGFDHLAHGANLDDLDDYRPGFKAAEELGIAAPLIDAGLGKADIRNLSRTMGLPTWDRPSMACLASRVPYGTHLTKRLLAKVEKAESVLFDLGIAACRVRHHGNVARIETDVADIPRLAERKIRKRLVAELKALGYGHVCLDLEGYITGSLNRGMKKCDS